MTSILCIHKMHSHPLNLQLHLHSLCKARNSLKAGLECCIPLCFDLILHVEITSEQHLEKNKVLHLRQALILGGHYHLFQLLTMRLDHSEL